MNIDFQNNEGQVTLRLVGRLDTVAAIDAQTTIMQTLAGMGRVSSLTLDASGLDYISSSGLRLLLMLANQYEQFQLTGASPFVYGVLESTGLTQLINVSSASGGTGSRKVMATQVNAQTIQNK